MESVEYYPPDDRENISGSSDSEEWLESQKALPDHKRDGYAERQYEIAEDLIKRLREEGL